MLMFVCFTFSGHELLTILFHFVHKLVSTPNPASTVAKATCL